MSQRSLHGGQGRTQANKPTVAKTHNTTTQNLTSRKNLTPHKITHVNDFNSQEGK
jgi:hypothetical protein